MAFFKGGAKEGQRLSLLKQQKERDRLRELETKKKSKMECHGTISASQSLTEELCPKFTARQDCQLASHRDTVGLVTLEELKAQQQQQQEKLSEKVELSCVTPETHIEEIQQGPISFNYNNYDDDSEGEEVVLKKKMRYGVNPNVDIRFVPDVYRKEEEIRLREELKKEWHEKQRAVKEEEVKMVYSYWDGSGHRREVVVKKGDTVGAFLNKCLERELRKEFVEVKTVSGDKLMYINDELIIAHHHSFYDLMVSKARGKSGLLLFSGTQDTQDGQAGDGKVCLRNWYERNKHIFPASRWEPYDPAKNSKDDQLIVTELDKLSAKIIIG